MKNNVLIQGLSIVLLFFGLWYGLSQVPWMKVFEVESNRNELDEKIGKLVWEDIQKTEHVMSDDYVKACLDSIVDRIAKANDLKEDRFHLHVIEQSEINAFALPGGHIVLLSELVEDAESADELAGVISHEMSHVQLNHIMKRLVREFGIAILLSANGNSGVLGEILGNITSSSFSREEESEADLTGANYLLKADIDPKPLANFLYRMGLNDTNDQEVPSWIMSHPEPEERSKEILNLVKDSKEEYRPSLSKGAFDKMKLKIKQFTEAPENSEEENSAIDLEEEK